jgi:hypothetical protein
MPDVDLVNRHPPLQLMYSKNRIVRYRDFLIAVVLAAITGIIK